MKKYHTKMFYQKFFVINLRTITLLFFFLNNFSLQQMIAFLL